MGEIGSFVDNIYDTITHFIEQNLCVANNYDAPFVDWYQICQMNHLEVNQSGTCCMRWVLNKINSRFLSTNHQTPSAAENRKQLFCTGMTKINSRNLLINAKLDSTKILTKLLFKFNSQYRAGLLLFCLHKEYED